MHYSVLFKRSFDHYLAHFRRYISATLMYVLERLGDYTLRSVLNTYIRGMIKNNRYFLIFQKVFVNLSVIISLLHLLFTSSSCQYIGWDMITVLFLVKNSRTKIDVTWYVIMVQNSLLVFPQFSAFLMIWCISSR